MWGVRLTRKDDDLGRALVALVAAKRERGIDWQLNSSWASDQDLAICRLRGKKEAGAGRVKVGTIERVLEWARDELRRMP